MHAGHATFHLGMSKELIMSAFPVDEAHAAFVISAFEELGLGRDFGSVLVLPVAGGEASYANQVHAPFP